jgi:hypothetical protein
MCRKEYVGGRHMSPFYPHALALEFALQRKAVNPQTLQSLF